MRVFVAGSRGIPNIPGGIETHCQNLYSVLALDSELKIRIGRRKPYREDENLSWCNMELQDIYSPTSRSFEAIVHTFLCVLAAKKWRADIFHVHGIGPSLLVPFAKLLGLKVVMTHHGMDYNRAKWGCLAKSLLRLGEKLGGYFADEVIVISTVIQDVIRSRCKRDSHLIFNGVSIPSPIANTNYIEELGLKQKGYILAVARIVPEKGLHDLLDAFENLSIDMQLVIAGDADHESDYSTFFKDKAKNTLNVTLTGYVGGDNLHQLYSHARLFVLPSYHEGLPIALLEALSYGIAPVVSDIEANLQVPIPKESFFKCGDVQDLGTHITSLLERVDSEEQKNRMISLVSTKYNWNVISNQTADVYKEIFR